jgi:hypothetical protein
MAKQHFCAISPTHLDPTELCPHADRTRDAISKWAPGSRLNGAFDNFCYSFMMPSYAKEGECAFWTLLSVVF